MAARRTNSALPKTRRPPATTSEARENQLISKAVDLAEKQLEEGTASAQVISHYLKLGSSREQLEQKRLELENSFLGAKTEALAAQGRIEELMVEAISAFRSYAGDEPQELDDYDEE
jgi:hypothetical protein